ncbi:hypothetical protein VSR68_39330 [Paraburkholderia phymatum]|uniref:hypothetical protein n=1 Tax=Paraburkholderia phymatum TaxID=148447 RepID=UPI00317A3DCB
MQPTTQQLDIFADSRDVMLRNDVLAPLERRDAVVARASLEQLACDYPDDGTLPALVSLRQELSRLHAGLFDAYMATRKVQHR